MRDRFHGLLIALRGRGSAASAAAIFSLGFVCTFLHASLTSHYVCSEHGRVTHDARHADGEKTEGDDQPPSDRPAPTESHCRWLAWLHRTANTTPVVQPDLVQLSNPAAHPAPPTLRTQTLAGRPVSVRHLSPINSPPRVGPSNTDV